MANRDLTNRYVGHTCTLGVMKLLVFDVEGTLFQTKVRLPGAHIDSTIWQALASSLGEQAVREEVATHARWAAGGYDNYLEWMRDTIAIHRRHGLSGSLFRRVIAAAEYHPEVLETLSRIDRRSYEVVLVSGGFRELCSRVQLDLTVNHCFAACEYLFGEDDTLKSFNLLPCDFHGKIDFIRLLLREYGLSQDDWIFVGDGLNDVPIASEAPLSIGFRPHEKLRSVVTHTVDNFSEVLALIR